MEQKSTNTFLKSKMNKDLDERLVPNGEYRDAVNIAISKSEGSSVGAAENIQGTDLLESVGTELSNLVGLEEPLEIIGQYVNEGTREIYLFLTNQGRFEPDNEVLLNPQYYNPNKQHWVVSVNLALAIPVITLYAGGPFLNFSSFYRINNINLLETQLFWTDNFNQPRSLDVTLGIPITSFATYEGLPFNKEDQISVCTYSPYKAINLYKDSGSGDLVTTLQDAVSSNLPYITYVDIDKNGAPAITSDQLTIINTGLPCVNPVEWIPGAATINGLQCWTSDGQITQTDHAFISAVAGDDITIEFRNGGAPIVFYDAADYGAGDAKFYVALENPNWQSDTGETVYPGDQTFLEDRFARFSYRFKFRNGAYSTIAPYTQDCFIPKQYGYFLRGDESATYQSTVVSFMENLVNRILLQIMTPEDESGNLVMVSELLDTMGISEIDIIYKEANNASLQVVETLTEETLVNYWLQATPNTTVVGVNTFAILKETIPVKLDHQRALLRPGGNLQNITVPFEATITNVVEDPLTPLVFTVTVDGGPWTFTAGDELIITQPVYEYDYQNNEPFKVLPSSQLTRVYDKVPVKALTQEIISNRITYANYQNKHTPPSTIDYQVGVSNKIIPGGLGTANAYVAYPNHTVKQNRNYQVGFVLSDRYGRTSSVILSNNPNEISTFGADPSTDYGADTIYHPYKTLEDFDGIENFDNVLDWPGDSIKLLVNNVIESVKDAHGVPGLYNGDDTSVKYNPLGWYSYKVVVKQKQQEYYNVYLPNIVNGLPQDFGFAPDVAGVLITAMPDILQTVTTKNLNEQATIVLINDNINKVPRDLTEVGPDQEQFRSSVRMWGRITPQLPLLAPFAPIQWSEYYSPPPAPLQEPVLYNQQYYPDIVSDTVSTIATQNDFYKGYVYNATVGDFSGGGAPLEYKPGTVFPPIYNTETNPLVATVTTQKGIGNSGLTNPFNPPTAGAGVPENEWPFILSVYETEPVESRLEIYWETSTSGLITDLNIAVEEGVVGIIDGIPNFTYDFKEDRDYAYVYNVGTATPYWDQADNPLAPQGTIITPDLYFDDALGTPVTTAYILDNEDIQWSVQDGNQVNVRWTPENEAGIFDIRRIPAGDQLANYEFSGVPTTLPYDTFVVEIKNNSVYLADASWRSFTFFIPAISQNISGEWIQVNQSFQMGLENVRPYWVIPTLPDSTKNFAENTFCPPGSTPPCIENPPRFKAENGTVLPSPFRDAELKYSITSITQNGQPLITTPPALALFTLQQDSLIWTAVKNPTLVASGQYEITIRVQDANGEGLYIDSDEIWVFGDVPVNCSFLMETAQPGYNSNVIPTINPTGAQGMGNGVGFVVGSQGGLILWTSCYDAFRDPIGWDVQYPVQFQASDPSLTGDCFSTLPAPPGVPWVWLWGFGNDPDCLLLPASQQAAFCPPQTLNVTEMTVGCPDCSDKALSTTNSIDLSYGPSWCDDPPSGLTQGTAFITLRYTQIVNAEDVINNEGLIIQSNFRTYIQARKEVGGVPTTPWSDSSALTLNLTDIEGNEINSNNANPEGLLSGSWQVGSQEYVRMNGGVLVWDDSFPLPSTDPYPFPYWNQTGLVSTNAFSTYSRVNGPAQDQFKIDITRTIAVNLTGGYKILISALKGTLTSLTAAQNGSCSETYTNDNNCAITIEYGDFYYPHGTQDTFWRYEVSQEGSPTQVAAQNYNTGQLVIGQNSSPNMDIVYAREPFFRYVTQFYTDQALTEEWTPQPSAGSWYMYRYATPDQDNLTPGINNVPLGNDGAAMSWIADTQQGITNGYARGQRRWIAQFGATGNKNSKSSFPVTSYQQQVI